MDITNNHKLRVAYEELSIYKMALDGCQEKDRILRRIQSLKKDIRKFHNRYVAEKVIVHDNGFDGAIIKIALPEWIETEDEAKEYFEKYEEIHMRPCAWDCTGQLFTNWYKVFNTNGRWRAYHSICADV